jgi:hypothetical protein
MSNSTAPITIIEPKKGWVPIDFKELKEYRELLYFLTKRDIKVRYKQTVLGGLWAVIQPVFRPTFPPTESPTLSLSMRASSHGPILPMPYPTPGTAW